jgi:transposase-like protein
VTSLVAYAAASSVISECQRVRKSGRCSVRRATARRSTSNYTEQSHRAVKQRYYPMLGFGSFESASRFCAAFDELRHTCESDAEETLTSRSPSSDDSSWTAGAR